MRENHGNDKVLLAVAGSVLLAGAGFAAIHAHASPAPPLACAAGKCTGANGDLAAKCKNGASAVGQAAALPHFDVASIIPQPRTYAEQFRRAGSPGPVFPGGRYASPQAVLAKLVAFAYPQFVAQRVIGLPSWAFYGSPDTTFYSIDAEPKPGTNPTMRQMRLMMRSLLADRFGLKFHIATKTMPVRYLTVGPHGTRDIAEASPGEAYRRPLIPLGAGGGIAARAAPMTDLAEFLTAVFQEPVIDRTGMKGQYNMAVQPGFDSGRPAIVALRDTLRRLGLVLERGKATVSVMVVDHVARPSPN